MILRPRIILPALAASTLLVAGLTYMSAPSNTIDCWEPPPEAWEEPEEATGLNAENFPMFMSGEFQWDGDAEVQTLGIDVENVSRSGDLIVATGRGTYTSWRSTDFTFRIEANPVTGDFTMWESNPSIEDGFVTEGRHVASFDGPLEGVTTRWIGDNGENGTLTLHAVENSARPLVELDDFNPEDIEEVRLKGGVLFELRHSEFSADCVKSDNDRVTVHYAGWNDAGEFDNSWTRGRPATFRPNQVIKGWTTALHEMCVGDFARVSIPADQAYGDNHHRASGDLTFDIEVIAID